MLESLRELNPIVYVIKTTENERLKSLRSLLEGVEKSAAVVVKGTESQRRFNKSFLILCESAVLSLSDIEDAVFEVKHPGMVASEVDVNDIDELSKKTLIHDISKHVSVGSKLTMQYMEHVGLSAIKSTTINRNRNKEEPKQGKRAKIIKRETSSDVLTSNSEPFVGVNNTTPSQGLAKPTVEAPKISNLLSTIPELEPLLLPWKILLPNVTPIPRVTVDREREKVRKQNTSVPSVFDVCSSPDASSLLQLWEQREQILNSKLVQSQAFQCRKRRRLSPHKEVPSSGSELEASEVTSASLFPVPGYQQSCKASPFLMLSIVHCGVSFIDLPS